jgi:DNA-3-methyladenine glycosylase
VPVASPLPLEFYERDTVEVAQALLGAIVVRQVGDQRRAGRVVETEAYVGADDLACHARTGPSGRAAVMYGPPGVAYVYLIYGMHHCLNAVTEAAGRPGAVLIRAIEPIEGIAGRTDGPGRICRELAIDRRLNGVPLAPPELWLEPGQPVAAIASGPRIGVDYAGEWAERPWRFWVPGSRWVSRVRAPTAPSRR